MALGYAVNVALILVWFLPGWLYRIILKSTVWFWWPLAFLGSETQRAREPSLFHGKRTSVSGVKRALCSPVATLLAFLVTNLLLTGAIFRTNPLLTVLGYLFVVNWSLPPWQLLALSPAILSLVIVFRINYVIGEYEYAKKEGREDLIAQALHKLGWVEFLTRLRLVLVVMFWLAVGCHTVLYFNGLKCWFIPRSDVMQYARFIYGNRTPEQNCADRSD